MKLDPIPWRFLLPAEILYPQSLSKQILNRNFTFHLRVTFVNVTEDYLSCVAGLATHLSTVI